MVHMGLPVQSLTYKLPNESGWETLLWLEGLPGPNSRYTTKAASAGVSFREALNKLSAEIEAGLWPEALENSSWAKSLNRLYIYMQENFPDQTIE
jgi:hypothetical protein